MRYLLSILLLFTAATGAWSAVYHGVDTEINASTITLWKSKATTSSTQSDLYRQMTVAWYDSLSSALALPSPLAGALIYGNSSILWSRLNSPGVDNKILHMSASGSTPSWSTTIWGDSFPINSIPYASAVNTIAAAPKTTVDLNGLISTSDTLKASGLTASRMVVTDANKKLATNSVTATEAGYLAGTTGTIQTQLNYIYTHSSGGGGGTWGSITGTLSAQTDLQAALDAKQPLDADLTYLAGFTPAANVKSILNAADYSAIRTLLALVIGTNVQAYDADLTTYAGITPSSNVQSLLGAANYAAVRTLLNLVAGTDIQAWDTDLDAFAALSGAADKLPYFTGAHTMAVADFTAAGRALIDDADASAQRTTLGLAIGTNVQAYDADLDTYAGITPSANIQSLLGSANYSAARTNLGLAIGTNVFAQPAGTTSQYVRGDGSLATTPIGANPTATAAGTAINGSAGTFMRSDGAPAIQNAAADGSTKGAAAFTASDFDAASGVISIDYTNGQQASHTAKGFLISGDWDAFNGKAAAGANTDITSVLLNQTGLVVKGGDVNALTIKPNETLTAGRILNLKVNDAARTIDLSGNLTVSSAATVSGTNTGDQTNITGNAGTVTTNANLTGPVTSTGNATAITDAAVTNAKMANMADVRIKSNISGGSAAPADNSMSAILDATVGSTRGAIAEKGASVWAQITPGTTAYPFVSNGSGADPSYQILPIAGGGTGQVTANAGFNALSPMTTAGDIIYGGTSGAGTRLAGGTSGYFLHSNGATSAPSWQANKVVIAVFQIGNRASVPATGIIGTKHIDKACHITGVVMTANASGSAVVDIGKTAYSAYSTTFGSSICASALPTITSAIKSQDETLTGWTLALAKDDILTFNLNSISTITHFDGAIYGTID